MINLNPFRKGPKFPIKVTIYDEREGGGLEVWEDLARRFVDKSSPGKTFYQLKKRGIKTNPSFFSHLIPGPKGRKHLMYYGVSWDELVPLEFQNMKEVTVHAKNEKGQHLYWQTIKEQVKDPEGNLLYHKTDGEGRVIEGESTNESKFPVEEEVVVHGEDGKPIMQTEFSGVPVETIKNTKIVKPTPANLRFWLARTQEEDKFKYESRSWFEKWGAVVILGVIGMISILIVLFTFWGINEFIKNISDINQGFHAIASSLSGISESIAGGAQTLGG